MATIIVLGGNFTARKRLFLIVYNLNGDEYAVKQTYEESPSTSIERRKVKS
jgi:hypothetical protein